MVLFQRGPWGRGKPWSKKKLIKGSKLGGRGRPQDTSSYYLYLKTKKRSSRRNLSLVHFPHDFHTGINSAFMFWRIFEFSLYSFCENVSPVCIFSRCASSKTCPEYLWCAVIWDFPICSKVLEGRIWFWNLHLTSTVLGHNLFMFTLHLSLHNDFQASFNLIHTKQGSLRGGRG